MNICIKLESIQFIEADADTYDSNYFEEIDGKWYYKGNSNILLFDTCYIIKDGYNNAYTISADEYQKRFTEI